MFQYIQIACLIMLSYAAAMSPVTANTTFLYLLTKKENVGDRNQVLGIAKALAPLLAQGFKQVEFDFSEKKQLLKAMAHDLNEESGNNGILIAVDSYGVEALSTITPQPNLVLVHTSHQFTKNHLKLKDHADIVALPTHALTSEILQELTSAHTAVVQTPGVAHNLWVADVKQEYEQNKDKLPTAKVYRAVILAGDAPTPDGTMRYYTPSDAQKLAQYISKEVKRKRAYLIVLNGPRTGKHDPQTGKVLETSHRDGHSDLVTQAFMGELKKQGVHSDRVTLLDFQHSQPSLYKAVIGLLLLTGDPIYVPGESTTMVSETADCLPQGRVIAYTHQAMNDNHSNHCMNECRIGRINLLQDHQSSWNFIKGGPRQVNQSIQPASEIVASAVLQKLNYKIGTIKGEDKVVERK